MNAGESTTKSFPGTSAPAASPPATEHLAATQAIGAPGGRGQVRLRWAVIATLAALAVLIAVRLGMVEGLLLRRVTISGPSMAHTLVGAHYRVKCADCGFAFSCDATDVPSSGLVVCPNCGYRANELKADDLHEGDHVLIDRWQLLWRGPARGEVVAARPPGKGDELAVKRVATLPLERLEIRAGDLFVGDQIVRKTFREWQDVRVLVHDNAFQPHATPNLPARWQAAKSESHWQADGMAYRWQSATGGTPVAAAGDFDWLEYQHWRCTESSATRTKLVPILDNDSFNQGLSRQLNPVTDVVLSCQVRLGEGGRLALAAVDGASRFEATTDPAQRQLKLTQDAATLFQGPLEANILRQPTSIEFGLCDQQVFLAIGGRVFLQEKYERTDPAQTDVLHPLAIGASGAPAEITGLHVWRDLYYLEPLGTARPWQADQVLTGSEFALLGDNPPVSIDSRSWPGSGGIARANVLGPVVRPFWAPAAR